MLLLSPEPAWAALICDLWRDPADPTAGADPGRSAGLWGWVSRPRIPCGDTRGCWPWRPPASAGALLAASRKGTLARALDRLALDGPAQKTVSALTYGGFAVSLGHMLGAGAPMADALRLAVRAVRSPGARRRLEPVIANVRQGRSLSDALGKVPGLPPSIVRLTAIGEASGGLGAMLARAGKLEEEAALRRIETLGRLIGPALIVALGGLIGLLMAGLLSGLTSIGDGALR